MAPRLSVRFEGDGVDRLGNGLDLLSGEEARVVYRRALTRVAKKGRTLVKRVAAKEMGVTQSALMSRNRLYIQHASGGRLETAVVGRGGYMVLKDFNATQLKRGVKASPWGTRRLFAGTFKIAKFGGNVYKRTTSKRFPLKILYGPAMPREMERPGTTTDWNELIDSDLPRQIAHEVMYLTKLEWRQ